MKSLILAKEIWKGRKVVESLVQGTSSNGRELKIGHRWNGIQQWNWSENVNLRDEEGSF